MPDSDHSRTTTVVFTDIEGHTGMMQRLGDAAGREVLRTHERIVREALSRYSGREVKSMGDGFMAAFNSAQAALTCAIALQRSFARYNATAEHPINVRVGVNAGEPIAEESDLFGQAVISASRIAGLAAGGEILVSLVVHELVAGKGFLFASRGVHELRGMDQPVPVYELHWQGEDTVPADYRPAAPAESQAWRSRPAVLIAAGGLTAVVAAAAGLLIFLRDSDPTEKASDPTATATAIATTSLTAMPPTTTPVVAIGAAGDLAFVSKNDAGATIFLVRFDGTNRRSLATIPAYDSDFSWSPNGKRFAYTARVDGIRQVMVANADGSGSQQLTAGPAENNEAVWSPDGASIAFTSTRNGNKDIYVMNANGSDQREVTTDPGDDMHPAWSPDGTKIAFASLRDGNRDVYTSAVDGSGLVRVTAERGNDDQPAWSPDGTLIAFTSRRDGNREIYVASADGSGARRLTDDPADDFHPAWAPDGQRIAFTSNRDNNQNREIYLIRADGSGLTRLTNNPAEDDGGAWFPATAR